MSKLRVSSFAVSLDGYGAGPHQDLEHPLGVGGTGLMEWFFQTRTWQEMHGNEGGETLRKAKDAAPGGDIRLGGGVATIRQYLQAGLIDELHLAIRPVLLGDGEAVFQGMNLPGLGYQAMKSVAGERATHVFLRKH